MPPSSRRTSTSKKALRCASPHRCLVHILSMNCQVYERGVELFTFPVSFEIWNIYLSKFIKRYVGFIFFLTGAAFDNDQGGAKLERARDLFEQALDKCPPKSCKSIFLMYAKLEEEYGLAKRAMSIYERATQVVNDADKFDVSIAQTTLALMSSQN